MRGGQLLVALASSCTLMLTACSSGAPARLATASADSAALTARLKSEVSSMSAQVAGLRMILEQTDNHPEVDPEPANDVDRGFYMAVINDVTTAPAGPMLAVDIVSDENYPGSDSHVWNKHVHVQRMPLDMDPNVPPVVLLGGPDGPEVVQASELVTRFKQLDASHELAYYVEVDGGKASRIWPVPFP